MEKLRDESQKIHTHEVSFSMVCSELVSVDSKIIYLNGENSNKKNS